MISAASGATSAAFGQLQRQQATRLAEQYEARAASLRAQAQSAENQADRANQQANNLSIQADQAQGRADTTRTAVNAATALGERVQTQSTQTVRALQRAQPTPAVKTESTGENNGNTTTSPTGGVPSGLLNLQGQRIGVRVNVSV